MFVQMFLHLAMTIKGVTIKSSEKILKVYSKKLEIDSFSSKVTDYQHAVTVGR